MGQRAAGRLSPAAGSHLRLSAPARAAACGENRHHRRAATRRRRASFSATEARSVREEIELVQGATRAFDLDAYRAGKQTPVFFGSAINNFGVEELLAAFAEHAPGPLPRATRERLVEPLEPQAHRLRVQDPGQHGPGAPRPHRLHAPVLRALRARHASVPCRGSTKEVRIADALTFMAADRAQARGGLRRRHHRPAQPRHDQHRRHLHRGRAAGLHGVFRASHPSCSAARC